MVVLLLAAADVGGGQDVEQGSPAVAQHGEELDHEDEGKDDEEDETQRLDGQRFRAWSGDVETHFVLHALHHEDDDDPEGVHHEEGEGDVVSHGLQIGSHLSLVHLVGVDGVKVFSDASLPDLDLSHGRVLDVSVLQTRVLQPSVKTQYRHQTTHLLAAGNNGRELLLLQCYCGGLDWRAVPTDWVAEHAMRLVLACTVRTKVNFAECGNNGSSYAPVA